MNSQLLELLKKICDLDNDGQITLKDLFMAMGYLGGILQNRESVERTNLLITPDKTDGR